jgi:ADP-ribose pyrophosphatase YjhB (NUDIX family)
MAYIDSYQFNLRQKVGHELLLMPGASVAVLDDLDRILLTLRCDSPVWCLPGGAAEIGSSFASTAVAELEEETGLRACECDLIAFACISDPEIHVLTYPSGDVTHCFAMWFLVRQWTGELRRSSDEVADLDFFDRDKLPSPLLKPSAHAIKLLNSFEETGRFQIS